MFWDFPPKIIQVLLAKCHEFQQYLLFGPILWLCDNIINLSTSLSSQLPVSILQGNVLSNASGFPLVLLLKMFTRCKNQQGSLLGTFSRGLKITHKNCAQILIAALFKVAKERGKQPRVHQRTDIQNVAFHVIEYYLTMKRHEVRMHYGSRTRTLC